MDFCLANWCPAGFVKKSAIFQRKLIFFSKALTYAKKKLWFMFSYQWKHIRFHRDFHWNSVIFLRLNGKNKIFHTALNINHIRQEISIAYNWMKFHMKSTQVHWYEMVSRRQVSKKWGFETQIYTDHEAKTWSIDKVFSIWIELENTHYKNATMY